MDLNMMPALIVSITGLLTAIGTLITVLRTHSTINTIQTQTNGNLSLLQSQVATMHQIISTRRAMDAMANGDPCPPPALVSPPAPPPAE